MLSPEGDWRLRSSHSASFSTRLKLFSHFTRPFSAIGRGLRTDQQAKREDLSPPERLLLDRQERAPRMKILDDWRARQFTEHTVEPNSGLGQAISTMQNHWHKLTLFLRVPGAPLDNDSCERAFKKAILHRKNALFYRTLNGARVGDLCMSLIPTAEGHEIEQFPYPVALQRLVAAVVLEPSAWMPWNHTYPGAGRRRIWARGELIADRP